MGPDSWEFYRCRCFRHSSSASFHHLVLQSIVDPNLAPTIGRDLQHPPDQQQTLPIMAHILPYPHIALPSKKVTEAYLA